MKLHLVKDIMVPLSGYAKVNMDATLGEAVKALHQAQEKFDKTKYRHRAILISDANNKIVGKLSQLDVIRALEPKYLKFDNPQTITRFGYTQDYLDYTLKEHQLWDSPLEEICRKAATLIVKDFMYTITEGEYVSENASINEAMHQIVMGHHQSLLVTRGEDIVGVLRLTDVFREISTRIRACKE